MRNFWVVFLLGACATSSQTYTPDGKVGHSIACSGTALSWGHCYEKAGQICGPKGYRVVAGGADQGALAAGTQQAFFAGSTISRSMVIQCKD
ncbi:MAG TPA: hypothetical protein VFU31_24610 [Candidatus Binatia bacterium]|nr:hypothetical protein [Candidatus Binatia bacterium]